MIPAKLVLAHRRCVYSIIINYYKKSVPGVPILCPSVSPPKGAASTTSPATRVPGGPILGPKEAAAPRLLRRRTGYSVFTIPFIYTRIFAEKVDQTSGYEKAKKDLRPKLVFCNSKFVRKLIH